jgi:hypothetical protein
MECEFETHSNPEQNIIHCNITKRNLDIIINIFLENCKLDVFGYNKEKNQYWGKNLKTPFYFLITVEHNRIILHPKTDENNSFPSFYKSLFQFIEIYKDIPDF